MDSSTPEPRRGVTPLQVAQQAGQHVGSYLEAARLQHTVAVDALNATAPDYSAAATACHRALQFTRQAEALEQLAKDAGLW